MARTVFALLAAVLVWPTTARAADGPAGSWRFTLPRSNLVFLMKIEEKDGKWSAGFLGSTVPDLQKMTFGEVAVTADALRLMFKVPGLGDLQFDGKLPPEAKTGRILGSLLVRNKDLVLAQLEPSKLKEFDKFEFSKEILDQSTDPTTLLDTALDLAAMAGEKKAKVEDVRGWADKAFKSAEPYGVRWQRTTAVRLAQAVSAQKEYAAVAVEYARKAERLIDPDDEPGVQMEALEAIAGVLEKAGKPEDARQANAQLAKLEERDYADYFKKLPFKPETYEGRKAKSDRAVLVELWTNVSVPTTVAPETALAALSKTYKPTEVVILQYDLNLERLPLDPFFTPDVRDRVQLYQKKIAAFPGTFVDGKAATAEGGPLQGARKAYGELRKAIDAQLEKNADAKLQLTATRKGEEIAIKATWADAAKTGENVKLYFALVEGHIRFEAPGVRYHHNVVRAFPGGAKGVAVAKAAGEQAVTTNLDDVRKKLTDYFEEAEIPKAERSLGLKNLRVVAFIQDNDSGDVLQATQVDVK